MTGSMPHDPFGEGWHAPFEAAAFELDLENCLLAGGVTTLATAVPIPGAPDAPGLLLRFDIPGSARPADVLLVMDAEHLEHLAGIIAAAAAAAVKAAG